MPDLGGQLAPGTLITDRLVVVRLLGTGGLGAVYEVEHKFTKHHRAVKVLHPKHRSDKDIAERFLKEASAAGRIGNPHIVETFDAGHLDDGSPFIVMEFLEGKPLRDVLRWNGRLDAPLTCALMVQTCNALQAAHDAGIVHRDLKPENLFLSQRDGKAFIKVLDFGVSKFDGDDDAGGARQTRSGITMGTPLYMAPEQLKGAKNADARSDVYSLGVILFEMLSGHVPFAANSFAELAVKVLSEQPPRLPVNLRDVPPELERLVTRAMSKGPADRFQSAAELADALQAFAGNHEVSKLLETHSAPVEPWAAGSDDTHTPPKEGPGEISSTAVRRAAAEEAPSPPVGERAGVRGRAAAIAVVLLAALATTAVVLTRKPPPTSVAVLPFDNTSKDDANDYLSEGLAESVLYTLTRSPTLKVMPRSSAARAKSQTKSAIEAGKLLHVDTVLSGDLSAHNVLHVELVDVESGALLWGERYELTGRDLLAVQSELAAAASQALKQETKPPQLTTKNAEAFALYLRGRYFWNKRTADGLARAVSHFREALDKDPAYAIAWVGLADSLALQDQYAGIPSRENCPQAKAAVAKALELDPKLATAQATRALLLQHCDFAWSEAEAAFQQAISLDPRYATARQWFALHYAYRGMYERGMEQAKAAQELDPLSLIALNAASVVGFYGGKWKDVLANSERIIGIDASFPIAWVWKGRALRELGDLSGAREAFAKAHALSGERWFEVMGDLGAAAALAKDEGEARRWLTRLEASPTGAMPRALILASLGEKDAAFVELEKAFEAQSWFLTQLTVDPLFRPLHGDERFTAYAKRVFP